MKFRLLLALTSMFLMLFSACSPKHSDIVVADYGKYNIKMGEFENSYAKNVGGVEEAKADSVSDYQNFLDLYVNFKMKLRDAEVRGLDADPKLMSEMNDYKKKVGVEYIKEKMIVDKGLKNLYNERKEEIRVSHIMIRPDTMSLESAKQLAESLIKRINNGESFEELAKKYSSDAYSKDEGGDIYYITAGQVIAPFEEAAYATPVGEIYPEPVQTRFGYHIIKVTERQKRRFQLRAEHILKNFTNLAGQFDSAYALKRITEIRDSIVNGDASFEDMAKKYSDDKGSGAKGGDLGYFERRAMVKEFDNAVFNMKVGEISGIVKTQYGYHIIKLLDEKPYPAFETMRPQLKNIYERTAINTDVKNYLDSLRTAYNYTENEELFAKVAARKDTTKFGSTYKESKFRNELKDEWAFKIKDKVYDVDSVMLHQGDEKDMVNLVVTETTFKTAVMDYAKIKLFEQAALDLEKQDSVFAQLMNDYRNGLYIFRLQEEEVWNKISVDSTKLRKLYEETSEDYKLPPRVAFGEIFTTKDSLAAKYYEELQNGADFEVLASKVTERPGMKSRGGRYDLIPITNNQAANIAYNIAEVGAYSEPTKVGNGWVIVKLVEEAPARKKTFEEAKPEVSSLYQENESKRLEQEYLNNLKSIYKPVIYYDELTKAFKPEEN